MKSKTAVSAMAMVMMALAVVSPAMAGQGHGDHSSGGSSETAAGVFEHKAMVEGLKTEFQVMSLASMNMNDPGGATHHVMLKVFEHDSGEPVTQLAGKVKVIAPSGKEQVVALKDYSGTYAANFTFDEKGKYGVICLFKKNDVKRVVKFWYPN